MTYWWHKFLMSWSVKVTDSLCRSFSFFIGNNIKRNIFSLSRARLFLNKV